MSDKSVEDALFDEDEAVVPTKPDRPVDDGDLDELVKGKSTKFTPDDVGAQPGSYSIIYIKEFFWREAKVYGEDKLEDILCFKFSTKEDGPVSPRFHFELKPANKNLLTKHYGRRVSDLVGRPIKIQATNVTVGSKTYCVWRPVSMEETEAHLDLNF